MPVSFNSIPANWKLPLFWLEVDPSKAGGLVIQEHALLMGQMFSSGTTGTADVPTPVASVSQAHALYGRGSMLARMVEAFLANNAAQLIYCVGLAEPGAGVAATGSLAITGPATAAGILSVYIAGQRIQVAVASGDTATVIGDALEEAINDATDLPVTAVNTTGTVALTARWKGETGNGIRLGVNVGGTLAGEAMPAGVAITITQMEDGAGAPTLTTAIANLGDEPYDYVGFPFTDSVSLAAIEAEYGFSDTGRWGWLRQLYGTVFSARRGSYSDLLTWGNTRNSGLVSAMGMEVETQSPEWEVAAAYAAQAARALMNDPARPLQTLELRSIVPAPKQNRFTKAMRNNLAGDGIAVQEVDAAGVMRIAYEATTYQTNAYGTPDEAYHVVTTMATLARLFRMLKQAITSKYPRHKLANDGTRFGPGQAIVTPKILKAEIVAQYDDAEFLGLVEDLDNFKAHLIVERDGINPNRANVLWPPDLINQFRMMATLAQFRLQYDRRGGLAA